MARRDFTQLSLLWRCPLGAQAAQVLSLNHTIQTNMASNFKGLYGIFYKTAIEVVKSKNFQ